MWHLSRVYLHLGNHFFRDSHLNHNAIFFYLSDIDNDLHRSRHTISRSMASISARCFLTRNFLLILNSNLMGSHYNNRTSGTNSRIGLLRIQKASFAFVQPEPTEILTYGMLGIVMKTYIQSNRHGQLVHPQSLSLEQSLIRL